MVSFGINALMVAAILIAAIFIIQEARVIMLKRKLGEAVIDIEKRNIQLSYITKTAQSLTGALNKQKLLRIIIETIGDVTKSETTSSLCALYLMDYGINMFVYTTGYNLDITMLNRSSFRLDDEPFKVLKKSRDITYFDEKSDIKNLFLKGAKARLYKDLDCGILMPLIVENEIMGVVISFLAKSTYAFLKKDLYLLRALANQDSIALGSAVQSELAVLDRLTKVYNHAYFESRLQQEISRANRYKYPVSLLMIDIDHFKRVNDNYGHQQGDRMLQKVAQIIRTNIRSVDLCARYGGEEFAVILPETDLTAYSDRDNLSGENSELGGALAKARWLREQIEKMDMRSSDGHPIKITVSIGVGIKQFPEGENIAKDDLIREADQQLYRAKQEGRNCVCHP